MIARIFLIMTLLLPSVNAKASDAKPEAHPAKTQGDAGKPPRGAAKLMPPSVPKDRYIHNWVEFPSFKGMHLSTREAVMVEPELGRVKVVVFLASWCIPCQQQIREIVRIDQLYRDHYTDFYYVFAHDTEADARGFATLYKLGDKALLASASALEAFHQPELPSFYVADRYKWLVMRRLNSQKTDLLSLVDFLKIHTAF